MLKAIIFDIDGTLVDSVDLHARAWQETFRHYGREVEFEKVRHQIGKGGDQLMPVFFPREELERFGEEMEKFRGDLFKREYISRVRAFPQVRELFERIRRDGTRIALASSAKKDELKLQRTRAHHRPDRRRNFRRRRRQVEAAPGHLRGRARRARRRERRGSHRHRRHPYDAEAAGKINCAPSASSAAASPKRNSAPPDARTSTATRRPARALRRLAARS
jgi:hypothetical protein